MTHPLATVTRCLLAAALAVSWLLAAGGPAAAEVTGWGVQTPSAGAVLDRATELIVYVDRTASPPEEEVSVHTRLIDGSGQPVSEEILSLKFKRRVENEAGGDQLIYGGTIDPYALAYLPDDGVAANGSYDLHLRVHVTNGEFERTTEWDPHPIVIDALPAPPGQAQVAVANQKRKRLDVSWEPSPTPDLMYYDVERRIDGGPWELAQAGLAPDTTQFSETVEKFGSYRYRVTAVRPSADGSGEVRATTGQASWTTELESPRKPPPPPPPVAEPTRPAPPPRVTVPQPAQPQFEAPIDANQTYEGPLDYGVEPQEVIERVPVEVAQGGATQEPGGVLQVLNRNMDAERVLPAVAGGLILVLSAAHVLRYLNE